MSLKKVVGKAIDDTIEVGKKVKEFVIDDTIEDIEKAIGLSEKKDDMTYFKCQKCGYAIPKDETKCGRCGWNESSNDKGKPNE